MNAGSIFEPEITKHRKRTRLFLWGCFSLLLISFISPFFGYFDLRPSFEAREVWFQRSGALTTIFALLSTTLKDFASSYLYSGGFGDKAKLLVKEEYNFRFNVVFAIGFVFTVIGTVIWGYGDTIVKLIESPYPLSQLF